MKTLAGTPVVSSTAAPSPRTLKAARDFQTAMLAELLKPLGSALVGKGQEQEEGSTAREFYGFMMVEAIARDLAARDSLRLHSTLIERMSRPALTGGDA